MTGQHFRALRNWHGVMAVYSALNLSAIQNLKGMWKVKHVISPLMIQNVSRKGINTIREIEKIIDARRNFKNYREMIKLIEEPFVPFEGLFLSDITFIEENPSVEGDLLNVDKMQMLGDILKMIKR